MSLNNVKVRFRLLYRPRFQGEQPAVVGSIPELGNWRVDPSCNLHQRARCLPVVVSGFERGLGNPKVWETVIRLPTETDCDWSWVILTQEGKTKIKESVKRSLVIGDQCLILHSEWNVLNEVVIPNMCKVDIRTKYGTLPGKVLGISGSTTALGNWDPKKCLVMDACYPKMSGKWRTSLTVSNEIEIEWKLVVIDKETREVYRWEDRSNRTLIVCSQWVKVEVTWGRGELVIDTISLDFDEYFNTRKILEAKRQAESEDFDAAASEELPVCPSFDGPWIPDVLDNAAEASDGMNHISAQASHDGNRVSTQASDSENQESAASELEIQTSDNKIPPESIDEVFGEPRQQPHSIAKARTTTNLKTGARADMNIEDVFQKTPDVKPKVVSNKTKVRKSPDSMATKRRLHSSQRQTSMRYQSPCQVLVNSKAEVVSCVMVDHVTDLSGDFAAQSGDWKPPEKSYWQEERFNERYLDPIADNGDVDDGVYNHYGQQDGQQRSTFFSFEKRKQALQFLGHHRNFTFFPAFLIFLKVINDYYWHTK